MNANCTNIKNKNTSGEKYLKQIVIDVWRPNRGLSNGMSLRPNRPCYVVVMKEHKNDITWSSMECQCMFWHSPLFQPGSEQFQNLQAMNNIWILVTTLININSSYFHGRFENQTGNLLHNSCNLHSKWWVDIYFPLDNGLVLKESVQWTKVYTMLIFATDLHSG